MFTSIYETNCDQVLVPVCGILLFYDKLIQKGPRESATYYKCPEYSQRWVRCNRPEGIPPEVGTFLTCHTLWIGFVRERVPGK